MLQDGYRLTNRLFLVDLFAQIGMNQEELITYFSQRFDAATRALATSTRGRKLIRQLGDCSFDAETIRELLLVADFASGKYPNGYRQLRQIEKLQSKLLLAWNDNAYARLNVHRTISTAERETNLYELIEQHGAKMIAAQMR
jgi:hypothetical protein